MKKTCLLVVLSSALCFNAIAEPANQDTLAQTGSLNRSDKALFGAEVFSLDKVLYGKFVTRMKLVSAPGVVSSFFTYDDESWQGEGRPWREIDFEVIGKYPEQLQTNMMDINEQLEKRQTAQASYF